MDGRLHNEGEEVATSKDRSGEGSSCCKSLKFVHHGNTLTFTREPGLLNGKAHYKADNGVAVIAHACGLWLYQPASIK